MSVKQNRILANINVKILLADSNAFVQMDSELLSETNVLVSDLLKA